MKDQTYEYYINLDERGEFYADVRDEDGQTVFEIKGPEGIEAAFMNGPNDLRGLGQYLRIMGVISKGSMVVKGE